MDWIKERVWQLGIGILLALVGVTLIYLGGVNGVGGAVLWLGLILFFIAMAIPLAAKVFEAVQEARGEEQEL